MNLTTPCRFIGNGKQVKRPFKKVNRKNIIYARWLWEEMNGPIPKGFCVCHGCDVGNCVNPEHLYLDTNRNNVLRARMLGRMAHVRRKLNAKKASQIRTLLSAGTNRRAILNQFGITERHLSKIANGSCWKRLSRQSKHIMKTRIYIDKETPFAAIEPEELSDGSVVWNLHIRGGETIACINEKAADKAAELLAEALTVAAGERPLVL